ncbi:MAG: peptide ABC transporter substrate-binding protein [Chloroflexota bacterium]
MVRNIRWQAGMAILGSLLIVALMGQLAAGRTTMLVPAVGGRYTEALVGYPQHINPLLARYGSPERALCALVFSGLTRAQANGDILPDLASSWAISPDGQTYTFFLRPDIRWHDGQPFTARDVVFTVQLMQSPGFSASPELAVAWQQVEVHQIDAYSVAFWLPQPYAPFLEQTTIGLLPAHLLNDVSAATLAGHTFNRAPVGTGPFRLEQFTAERARLAPHAQYHGGRTFIGSIELLFYPDVESALDAYSRGEVLALGGIPASLLAQAASLPDLELFSLPLNSYTLIVLNNRHPILADVQVRRALAHALDRQALVDGLLYGQGIVIDSPIPAGHWAHEPDVQHYDYDVGSAGELLQAAGWGIAPPPAVEEPGEQRELGPQVWREKSGQPLTFTLLTDNDPVRRQLATALADRWARVGAQVTVQSLAAAERDALLFDYQFDAALLQMVLPADPDLYPWWHSTQANGGQNLAGLNNLAIDQALQQARLVTDRAKRWALYSAFQRTFAQQEPAILLFREVYTFGIDRKVKNVQAGPLLEPSHRFRDIHHWYLVTQRVLVQKELADIR